MSPPEFSAQVHQGHHPATKGRHGSLLPDSPGIPVSSSSCPSPGPYTRSSSSAAAFNWASQVFKALGLLLLIMVQFRLVLALAGGATALNARQATSSGSAQPSGTVAPATSSTVPDYFEITPRIYNGPTQSGALPFLAETNTVGFGQATYYPPDPLATHQAIVNNTNNGNVFQLMGQLSHYFPNPSGFGVNEMALPQGSNITWLNMLSRHGSRYPTSNSIGFKLGNTISAYRSNGTTFSGNLSFLNSWVYSLGYEVLVPIGKSELFESGISHFYKYGHLWNRNQTLLLRTTTQERMRQSAENWAAGFSGDINYQSQGLKIEYVIEQNLFNNSLAGYFQCNNSNTNVSYVGDTAAAQWEGIYLKDAVQRFNSQTKGFNWTTSTVYAAQQLCPYETVALGFSAFCDLFTYQEWEGYEYSVDLDFAGNNMFQSPTGRAVGVGYVQEFLARLQHQYVNTTNTQDNVTLDSMPSTFPLNQSLNMDFSHDTNIASILTAFNFTQFSPVLDPTAIQRNRSLMVSHMTPFGARLDIEVIEAPRPVSPNRTCAANAYDGTDVKTQKTKYIHFILNQRTLPLYPGYPECGNRTDGWCELNTFLAGASKLVNAAQYNYSCNGKYSPVPYGTLTNGVPAPKST